jgi:hypothetical protein
LVIIPRELSARVFKLHQIQFINLIIKQISPMLVDVPSIVFTFFSNEIEITTNQGRPIPTSQDIMQVINKI